MTVKFKDTEVKAVFDAYKPEYRKPLLQLREWTFDIARNTSGVGPLEETLKWQQPSYLTTQTKAGSTVRMDWFDDEDIALFFNCQTTLVESFRTMFGDELSYSKNRAVILPIQDTLPEESVRQCLEMALTYHLRKKKVRSN
jgi:hypothetical protein